MIHLMLNHLRRKPGILPMLRLEVLIQEINLNLLIPCAGPHPFKGQTPFLGLILPTLPRNHRINHGNDKWPRRNYYNPLPLTNHVGGHTNAVVHIRFQGIHQIFYNLLITFTQLKMQSVFCLFFCL